MLEAIEQAATAVLTLTEGIEQEEFGRSRLTRDEVRRQLLSAARAVAALSDEAQSALQELDFAAWRTIGEHLDAGQPVEGDSGWFAIRSLLPATLAWLRVYRNSQPGLFQVFN